MDFSTIMGFDGYFCSVITGKALHQYTFKIKVLRNHPELFNETIYYKKEPIQNSMMNIESV